MILSRFRKKQLKMIWRAEKHGRSSCLVGTAHFFPYSFKGSLTRLLSPAEVVLFEGPLDDENMARVVKAGFQTEGGKHLFDGIDGQTIGKINEALGLRGHSARMLTGLHMLSPSEKSSAYNMVEGMKPWMAFFALYSYFVQRNGWKYSVDMEAYKLAQGMGKEVVFLEDIDEQIEVLETLSVPQILDFIRRVEQWKSYTRNFVKWYLAGDLEKIAGNPYGFPTRNPRVIDHRDKVFYKRMKTYLEAGNAVACVGVPHIVGISLMLTSDGYSVEQIHT